jgi:hypothetical protein
LCGNDFKQIYFARLVEKWIVFICMEA